MIVAQELSALAVPVPQLALGVTHQTSATVTGPSTKYWWPSAVGCVVWVMFFSFDMRLGEEAQASEPLLVLKACIWPSLAPATIGWPLVDVRG